MGFIRFLKRFYPDKLNEISDFIANFVFDDEENVRTAKVLQKALVKFYEENKDDERINFLHKYLKIRSLKELSEIVNNLKKKSKIYR
jgi:ferritin